VRTDGVRDIKTTRLSLGTLDRKTITDSTVAVATHPTDVIEHLWIWIALWIEHAVFQVHKHNPTDHKRCRQRSFPDGNKLVQHTFHLYFGPRNTRRTNPNRGNRIDVRMGKLAFVVRKLGCGRIHLFGMGIGHRTDREFRNRHDVAQGVFV